MKMIYKYPLGMDIHHNMIAEVELPKGAKILCIQMQTNIPMIWAIVNPKNQMRKHTFHVFGTGFEMKDYDKKCYEYISTVQQKASMVSYVWHVFEVHE